jgi:exonuclease VII large subunit
MRAIIKAVPVLAFFGGMAVLRAQTPPPAAPSVSEMQVRSTAMVSQMQEDLHRVMYLKEQAKKDKDVIKLNCVNDKLILVKGQMELADTTNAQLQDSLSKNSADSASLYVQLSDTSNSIKTLLEEANACVGVPELMKQESGVTVERPEVPDDPTITDPFGAEVEPPAYASPYR